MARIYLFLALIGSSLVSYAQSSEKLQEVIFGYSTLDLKDVEMITSGVSAIRGVNVSQVCYNHNVVVISAKPGVTELRESVYNILNNLRTSSTPVLKTGDSSTLECDTQVPAALIERQQKQ